MCENTVIQLGFTGSITEKSHEFLKDLSLIRGETSILTKRVFGFFENRDGKVMMLNRETGNILNSKLASIELVTFRSVPSVSGHVTNNDLL